MVAIRSKVTLRRRGNLRGHIHKIETALKGPKAVKVGLPAGKSPADVVQIGIWNHFGTAGSGKGFSTPRGGGFGGPIPPRPFITVAMFKGRAQIRMNLRKIAYEVTVNGKPMTPELQKLGAFGAALIQQTIADGGFAPNSATTIRLKGTGKKPLTDEGRLRASIGWELDGGGPAPKGSK